MDENKYVQIKKDIQELTKLKDCHFRYAEDGLEITGGTIYSTELEVLLDKYLTYFEDNGGTDKPHIRIHGIRKKEE